MQAPPANPADIGNSPLLSSLAAEYQARFGFSVLIADANGQLATGTERAESTRNATSLRRQAIYEALRWGEPSLLVDEDGNATWAVPIMENERLLGGLVVEGVSLAPRDDDGVAVGERSLQIREACTGLLSAAIRHNLTQASRLELARTEKSLVQIAFECGYSDQSYFTRVFRKYTAESPGEYRKRAARQSS